MLLYWLFLFFPSNCFAATTSASSQMMNTTILLIGISIFPALLMICTSFTRISIVLSILRNAIGLQQSPPNIVIVSLSFMLTGIVMGPIVEKIYNESIVPLTKEKITYEEAFEKFTIPLKEFMVAQTSENDLVLFKELCKEDVPTSSLRIILPSFLVSELKKACEIGFLLFIPFMVIDFIVASILMCMGMVMVPPTMVALPFKLMFFVSIDGWKLIVKSLVKSFS